LPEAARIIVGRSARRQHGFDLMRRLQAIDQLVVERQLREVAFFGFHFIGQGGDHRAQRVDRQLAGAGDIAQIALPQVVHPVQVGFARCRRGRIENVRLGGGLVFADAEQVHVHAEFVLQRFAVIQAIAAEAFEQHAAIRIQVNLVGLRGEVILLLLHHRAVSDDLLAAAAEFPQRRAEFAQRGKSGDIETIGQQDDALDFRVGLGGVDYREQVAQLEFARVVVVGSLRQCALERRLAVLLDQRALHVQHQRGLVAQRRDAGAGTGARRNSDQADHKNEQQGQQQHEKHHVIGEADQAPHATHKTPDRVGTHLVHLANSKNR